MEKCIEYGLLKNCESKMNTPILPVEKANREDYQLVQDSRDVNKIVEDIYLAVASPYTLLTCLSQK